MSIFYFILVLIVTIIIHLFYIVLFRVHKDTLQVKKQV